MARVLADERKVGRCDGEMKEYISYLVWWRAPSENLVCSERDHAGASHQVPYLDLSSCELTLKLHGTKY